MTERKDIRLFINCFYLHNRLFGVRSRWASDRVAVNLGPCWVSHMLWEVQLPEVLGAPSPGALWERTWMRHLPQDMYRFVHGIWYISRRGLDRRKRKWAPWSDVPCRSLKGWIGLCIQVPRFGWCRETFQGKLCLAFLWSSFFPSCSAGSPCLAIQVVHWTRVT